MKKLQLPPAVLNGTPLTESEMKEILGGMQYYRRCSCTLTISDGTYKTMQLPMEASGITCAEACKYECDLISARENETSTSCQNYNYKYEEGRY